MTSERKICFITGTRADYGLLSRLMRLVDNSPSCRLQVIATNMHLLPEYGETYREIEADGFVIDEKVEMRKPEDSAHGIVASMAMEMAGMNDAIERLRPDLAVILGDRYEMLVAATVCMLHRIPIAHLHGGEITEAACDDAIRHCITKMSALHFTSTEEYRRRVVQLGEQPDRVFNVGSLGVENLKTVDLMTREQLEQSLGMPLSRPFLLATYHPVTLGQRSATDEIRDFLRALDRYPGHNVIFTMPNSDQGGDEIRFEIERYCKQRPDRCACFTSLGMRRYLSLMPLAEAVIGNSSSGLIEAPSAGIPTLNIGDRQKGRARGETVVDCASDEDSIAKGLAIVLSDSMKAKARSRCNPYAKEGTARSIFETISTFPLERLQQKQFYTLTNINA